MTNASEPIHISPVVMLASFICQWNNWWNMNGRIQFKITCCFQLSCFFSLLQSRTSCLSLTCLIFTIWKMTDGYTWHFLQFEFAWHFFVIRFRCCIYGRIIKEAMLHSRCILPGGAVSGCLTFENANFDYLICQVSLLES